MEAPKMASPTATKAPAPLPETLPEYLGLGELDPESVKIGPDEVVANYTVDSDLLYHVTVSAQGVQLGEFLDGEVIGVTSRPDSLEQTFFRHLFTQLPYDSRRFERLYHRLGDDRNVLVRFAGQPRYFYYPAGYLFALRQPIVGGNQAAFEQIVQSTSESPESTVFALDAVREGVVLRLLSAGEVTAEAVRVADFRTTLHRVAESTDRLLQRGLVPKEKEYQLAVLDSSLAAAGNLTAYLGDLERGIQAFSVVVTEGTDWTMEKLQNDFGAGACQMLENMKR
jgi:hypothetical protein